MGDNYSGKSPRSTSSSSSSSSTSSSNGHGHGGSIGGNGITISGLSGHLGVSPTNNPNPTHVQIWNRPSSQSIQHQNHQILMNDHQGNERSRLITNIPHSPSGTSYPISHVSHPKAYMDFFEDREGGGGMRVGRDYQAKIPALVPKEDRTIQSETDRALLVWCPSEKLTDEQVEQYLAIARDKYQYSGEQALGLLFWHRYDINKAIQDLGNFTPNPEEWTIEDKVLFEQAFQFHGKAFDKIRQMLPEKSMSSLIRYYYRWKKLRCKTSVMDRQVKKFSQEDGDDQNAPPVSNNNNISNNNNNNNNSLQAALQNHHLSIHPLPLQPNSERSGNRSGPTIIRSSEMDSDSDDVIKQNAGSGICCQNCGVPSTELHVQNSKDGMCNTCFLYWKKTGDQRPLTNPHLRRGDRQMMGLGALRQRRTPPKGMYINHDDLTMLASAPPQAENWLLKQGLEKELLDLKHSVQNTKQGIELLKTSIPTAGLEDFKVDKESAANTSSRINARWTQEELMLAAQGVRRYGKNFQKIAEVMGTKTETHLKIFYANYRKRYNLDSLVEEHNLENENMDDVMIVDDPNVSSSTPSNTATTTATTPNSNSASNSTSNSANANNIRPRHLEF